MNAKIKGYTLGAIAAATYGMNPLFALPLYSDGMDADSVLFFRYLFAIPILGIMIKARGRSFRLNRGEILPLVVLGLLVAASSLTLFLSYNYMDAGIASTILFVYPIMVALIMTMAFKEKITLQTAFCILLALAGIGMLYQGGDGATLSLAGTLFVLASALTYAIYIVGINQSSLKNVATLKVTFYILLFGVSLFLVRLDFGQSAFASQSVAQLISSRIGVSLCLAILSLAMALLIAFAVVALALMWPNAFTQALYKTLSTLSLSLPSFVLSLVLVLVFPLGLGVLPSGGYVAAREDFGLWLTHMVLPVLSLGFMHSGLFMRLAFSSLRREEGKSYMRLVAAKGSGRGRALFIHGGGNILGELLTLASQSLVSLFTSSAAVESVFSSPGLGSLTVSAIARRDMATLMALVMLGAFFSALVGALADTAAALRDRRRRLEA